MFGALLDNLCCCVKSVAMRAILAKLLIGLVLLGAVTGGIVGKFTMNTSNKTKLGKCLHVGIVISTLPESPKATTTTKGKTFSKYSNTDDNVNYYQLLHNIWK